MASLGDSGDTRQPHPCTSALPRPGVQSPMTLSSAPRTPKKESELSHLEEAAPKAVPSAGPLPGESGPFWPLSPLAASRAGGPGAPAPNPQNLNHGRPHVSGGDTRRCNRQAPGCVMAVI